MDRIVDLTESRKARSEKSEQYQESGNDLLLLLERQRENIPEEYLAFLLALAISDQALYYAKQTQQKPDTQKQTGLQFIDHLFLTARQLFETHYPLNTRKAPRFPAQRNDSAKAQVLEFPPGHEAELMPVDSLPSPQKPAK